MPEAKYAFQKCGLGLTKFQTSMVANLIRSIKFDWTEKAAK